MATVFATAALHMMDSTSIRNGACAASVGGFLPHAMNDDISKSSDDFGLYMDDDGVMIRSDESSVSDDSDSREVRPNDSKDVTPSCSASTLACNKRLDWTPQTSDEPCAATAATGATADSDCMEVDASKPPPVAFIETDKAPDVVVPLIKPALKRVSSYGILMEEEEIPICTKKSAWKTLPAPTGPTMRRIQSTGSFYPTSRHTSTRSSDSQETTEDAPTSPTRPMKRNVSFAQIHVRDYELTMGNNPACTYGTPLTLDWSYVQHDPLELDQYEDNRPKRRNPRQMLLNSIQRQHILRMSNFSDAEILKAKREAERIQRQRAITAYFSRCMKIEDAVESAARKTKRFLRHRKSDNALPPHSRHADATTVRMSTRSLSCLDEEDTIDSACANESVARSIITI